MCGKYEHMHVDAEKYRRMEREQLDYYRALSACKICGGRKAMCM
jgi:hypothetical protein